MITFYRIFDVVLLVGVGLFVGLLISTEARRLFWLIRYGPPKVVDGGTMVSKVARLQRASPIETPSGDKYVPNMNAAQISSCTAAVLKALSIEYKLNPGGVEQMLRKS